MWYPVPCILAACQLILAACQPETPTQESSAAVAASRQLGDAWLSPELAELVITRMVGVASARYELDAAQQGKFRDAVHKHWDSFLAKNQSHLRRLVGAFLQMRMAPERPGEARLEDWVARAAPVLEELRREFNAAAVELRAHLNPSVREKFDADVDRLSAELKISEPQVRRWCADYFEDSADEGLFKPTGAHEGLGAPRNDKEKSGTNSTLSVVPRPAAPDQILIELDAWTIYVQEFMRTMDLDTGQRDAVLSVLSEVKLRARAHRDRRREEILRLERAIASFQGSAEELKRLEQQLIELYGPIDIMFGELQRRIEQVPTATQQDKAKKGDY